MSVAQGAVIKYRDEAKNDFVFLQLFKMVLEICG